MRRRGEVPAVVGGRTPAGVSLGLVSHPDRRGIGQVVSRPLGTTILAWLAGVGLLAAGAWLWVPFYPVPMTMQTLAVLLVGGLLGPRLGVAAVAGYLALGLAGAPVFHGGLGGPLSLLGPTGGYLLGFLPAAFLMGFVAKSRPLSRRSRLVRHGRLVELVMGAVLAEAALYVVGLPWLALVAGVSLGEAAGVGLLPFVAGDLLKMAVAVGAIDKGRGMPSGKGPLPF